MGILEQAAERISLEDASGTGDPNQQLVDVLRTYQQRSMNKGVASEANFVGRSLAAGDQQWRASLNYFQAVGGDIFGFENFAKEKAEKAQTQEQYAQMFREANGVKDWETLVDDGSVLDWAKYFASTGIEIGPHIAATLATGGAAGVAALTTKGLLRLAGKKAKDVAKDKFVRNASILGAFAHEYSAATGDTYGFTGDAEASAVAGAPIAALNLWAQVAFAKALTRTASGSANQQAAKSYYRKVTEAAALGAAREGVTEELQTEFQLLAKAATADDFDFFGDDANTMRLQSAVTGAVLGKTISGTTTAIGAPIGDMMASGRRGFEQGQNLVNGQPEPEQLQLDLREPEQGMVPETPEQIATQLQELQEGRGREAVQVTSGPLPQDVLEANGLQQVELDGEQGVLVARVDQDINELKAAFESGSRDVLGNGTINKPIQGDLFEEPQVVRAVNADGSRGADVVSTSDTAEAVTAAQEAKSDINETETLTPVQALLQRAQQTSQYTDEEIAAELSEQGGGFGRGVDLEAVQAMSNNDDVPFIDYKSGLSPMNGKRAPYQSQEAAQNAIEQQLVPMRVRAEEARLNRKLTDEEVQSITDSAEVVEVNDGFVVREYASDVGFDQGKRIENVARGSTKRGSVRLTHAADFNKRLIEFLQGKAVSFGQDLADAGKQVFGVRTPEGVLRALDIKAVAEAGWRELSANGATAATEVERLNLGLAQGLGTLLESGYTLDTNVYGEFDLSLDESKTFGRDGPTIAPQRGRDGLTQAFRSALKEPDADKRRRRVARILDSVGPYPETEKAIQDPVETSIQEQFGSPEEKQALDAQRQENRTPSLNEAELRERSEPKAYDRWETIPSTSGNSNIKLAFGTKSDKLLNTVIGILGGALKFTNTNILVVDSASLRKLRDSDQLTDSLKTALSEIDDAKGIAAGLSLTDIQLPYGIVYVNTRAIREKFTTTNKANRKIFDAAGARAYTAFVVSHELGHQYFENVITQLPEADFNAFLNIMKQSSSAEYYFRTFAPDVLATGDITTNIEGFRTAINEFFADQVGALSMDIIGKRARQFDERPDFFKQSVDNAFRASSVNITEDQGPQIPLFREIALEQMAEVDLVRDPDGNDIRRVKNKIKDVAKTLRKIYDTWKSKFVPDSDPRTRASDPLFNQWLANVVRRQQESPVRNARQQFFDEQPVTPVPPKPDPRRRPDAPQQGATPKARVSYFDNSDFTALLDDYNVPRNRIQFEQTSERMYRGGVSSFLGKLLFSAHEQLTVMGAAGRRIANALYKKSQTIARDGFLNRSLYQFNVWTAELNSFLPDDKEKQTQILDEYALWREAGQDISNIPDTIRPYWRKLNKWFADFNEYMAAVNPRYKPRENYFMHMYDPEMLRDPTKVEALVQLLVTKQKMQIDQARKAVEGMRANLLKQSQAPNTNAVTAHSEEIRKWDNLTYSDLRSIGVLYNPRTAIMKYAREMTRSAEFNRLFGGYVVLDNGERVWRSSLKLDRMIADLPADKQAQAQHIIDGMLGRLGNNVNPEWAEAQSWMMAVQFSATLLFATLASLPDIMMPALRSREFRGLSTNINQITQLMRKESRQDLYNLAYSIGSITTDVIHESIISGYGSEWMSPTPRKYTDAFFKMIGLEHWTRMTRVVATGFARDFLLQHANQPNARSARYLEELGITAEAIQTWDRNGRQFDTQAGKAVQLAMLRFVDEAIMRPNSAERPTYGSDPRFMIFFQLKGFYYSFGQKVVGGIYREMQARRAAGESIPEAMSPMILAGVALMPLAALALSVREGIKYEEGEAPTDDMDSSEYLFELVSRSGFLGPLEIPKAMFDAGDYGLPFWAAPMGPTVGTGIDLVKSDGFDALEELIPVYNQFN